MSLTRPETKMNPTTLITILENLYEVSNGFSVASSVARQRRDVPTSTFLPVDAADEALKAAITQIESLAIAHGIDREVSQAVYCKPYFIRDNAA
jgi:hypothetical protein